MGKTSQKDGLCSIRDCRLCRYMSTPTTICDGHIAKGAIPIDAIYPRMPKSFEDE